jgi:hypothetical protein
MTVPPRRPTPLVAALVALTGVLAAAAALVACGTAPAAPPITVHGRVALVTGFDVPLAGVLVHVQGTTTTTDADGRFVIADVRPPYTVILGSGGTQPWVHAYEGLTTPTPTLSPHAVIYVLLTPTAFQRGTIEGSLSNPLIAGRRIELCAVGLAGVQAYGCDTLEAGEQAYSIDVAWREPGPVNVRLYALQYLVDADDRPTAVLSNGWVDRVVTNGATFTQAVPSGAAPASNALAGAIQAGGGITPGAFVRVRTEGAYVLPVYSGSLDGGVLDFQAPSYADPEVMVSTYAAFQATGGLTFAWSAVDPTRPFTVSVPAPPQLLEPADGATGADASTVFRALGGPAGARTFSWSPRQGQTGPTVSLTTMQNQARVPDVALVGQAWPVGGQYDWSVAVVAAPDLATAAAFPAIGIEFFFGTGIGQQGTGAVAFTAERQVDLAP